MKKKNSKTSVVGDNTEDQGKEARRKRFHKKNKKDQIIRIEELEEIMSQYGDDVDPEDIVSMYMPHRKRRRIGAALLQMDRQSLFSRITGQKKNSLWKPSVRI